jgi:nucleoside-diphosphate-sugar epimerase
MAIDRYDRDSLQQAADVGPWDIVYDQIYYASDDAREACEAFQEKVRHYVFTSSLSVYGYAEEAARFLLWAGESEITGPINACSQGTITLRERVGLIEEATHKQAILKAHTEEENMPPYGVEHSWYMDAVKAANAGFVFSRL